MTANSEDIKHLVRERYGAKARGAAQLAADSPPESAGAPCCGLEGHGQSEQGRGPAEELSGGPGTGVIGLTDVSSLECDAGESGAGECGAGECGAGECGAGECGAGECGAGECGAGESGAGCCGPDDLERALRIYQEGQISGLPAESVAASAGCGNPTALAGLRLGERVLDLGSGGGIDCFLAARQVGGEGRVIGLDMTPDMLELARQNQAKLGLTNVEFLRGEMEDMPLPDSSVDVVISNCVVCLSPDKDAVFRESFRVLAPGGRIHLSDMMALSSQGPARADPEAWVSCIAGAEDRDVYLGRLRRAGFVDIEISWDEAQFDGEEGAPLNVASVKVVARRPA